jgi:hypothetical protein
MSPSRQPAVVAALARVWALPATIVGLLLSPFFKKRTVTRGVLLCEGASWPRRFGWHYRAITFGHVVLAVDELDDDTMDHELVHVGQFERWGVLLGPAYLMASIAAAMRGGSAYRDNHFERQARARAGTIRR